MGTLYIDRKDVELRQEGVRLLVYEQGRRSGSVPITHLERVVIHRRAVLDTGLLGAFAEHGVALVVLNPRKPQRTVRLPGGIHNDVARRVAQYRRTLDEVWRSRWSAAVVSRKIRSQKRVLKRALNSRPDRRHALTTAVRALDKRLGNLRGPSRPDRERIRGLEGAAAAAYFQGYCSLFAPALNFTGRNRRPPRDPVNACLSLGYTMLHSEAVAAVQSAGLDPMLGFYHDLAFGRNSLALDLIEPLRPRVDAWVWRLFRERALRVENFSTDKGACLLNKAGRKVFYGTYERFIPPLRRGLRRYTRLLAHSVMDDHEER